MLGAREKNGAKRFAAAAGVLLGLAAAAVSAITACHAAVAPLGHPGRHPWVNDYGGVGMLQTPTARVTPDGELLFGISSVSPHNRMFVSMQFLPWLETTLRYTEITNRWYSADNPGAQTDKDRGIDFKVRLLEEGRNNPEVAVGFRDLGGTSLFGSEYVVASKRYYDLDFSLGLGWGQMGARGDLRNPLSVLFDRFKTRTKTGTVGGAANIGSWFAGEEIALFGSVRYDTPIDGLSLVLELDGNDYQSEPQNNNQDVALPINFGLKYRPWYWLDTAIGVERGNTLMMQLTARTNLQRKKSYPKLFDPPPTPVAARPRLATGIPAAEPAGGAAADAPGGALAGVSGIPAAAEPAGGAAADAPGGALAGVSGIPAAAEPAGGAAADAPDAPAEAAEGAAAAWPVFDQARAQQLFTLLEEQEELLVQRLELGRREVRVFTEGGKYAQEAKLIGRLARVLANHLPAEVELFRIVRLKKGVLLNEVAIWRKDLENALNWRGSPEEVMSNAWVSDGLDAPPAAARVFVNLDAYPRFSWDILPGLTQHMGGPDNFYFYDIYANLSGEAQLAPGLFITAELHRSVQGNLDGLKLESISTIPHVRSDIKHYLQHGENAIAVLQADYLFNMDNGWYGRLSGGLFEQMFGGVGGELLYWPRSSDLALGLDLNWVRQRDFDQRFSFRDYDIATGHLSAYYNLPFYNLLGRVSMGRYLAGDVGATFDLSRRFDNGMEVGAFFTLTNLSPQEFGEGSFDKGFYLRLPFDLISFSSTNRKGAFVWRPLTKDGGQRVNIVNGLYGTVRGQLPDRLAESWDRLLE